MNLHKADLLAASEGSVAAVGRLDTAVMQVAVGGKSIVVCGLELIIVACSEVSKLWRSIKLKTDWCP